MRDQRSLSRFGRAFWWAVCLYPPFMLLLSIDSALHDHSADEALGLAFLAVPLWILLFLGGAVLVVGAARSRALTKREQSFFSVLGISPGPIIFLFGTLDQQLRWPKSGASRAGVMVAVVTTVLWVFLAVWFRRSAWPPSESSAPTSR